jgi:hypothetical protein
VAKRTLKDKVTAGHEALATPALLRGKNLSQFSSIENLGLVERSTAFGINTAAMYRMVAEDEPLQPMTSILLRVYSAFPESVPRIVTPSFSDFIALIRKADPEFKEYSAGPLLGMDKNSIYRIRETGFDGCKDATKILINAIYKLLSKDVRNWKIIKEIVDVEAESRDLDPATIWKKGKWFTNGKKEEDSGTQEA